MARALYDTAHDVSTPAAGKYKDIEARIKEIVALLNEHATDLDVLDANLGGTLTADAPGRAKIAAGFFNAATVDSAFAVGVIGQELLEPELDETVIANVTDAAPGGVAANVATPKLAYSIAHADHATETLVYKTTRKIEFVGMTVLKSAAGAANTVKLTDGADADISDAVAADTDKAVTRAAQLDVAKRTIAAGGTFKLVFTRAAGSSLCEVVLDVLLRA